MCDIETGTCMCKTGYMDADDDRYNGCETKVMFENIHFTIISTKKLKIYRAQTFIFQNPKQFKLFSKSPNSLNYFSIPKQFELFSKPPNSLN